jgi:hypothetical protein
MAKSWNAQDIRDLKTLAQNYSVQAIAEKMDRSVGGVAFKAHQLGLALKARSRAIGPGSTDFNWTESHNGRPHLTNGAEVACPAALEAKVGSDAVCAAGLAAAVGIQRMGREDTHADQREDTG